MSGGTTICEVCGQPKSISTAGSLTQWIAVCQCGLLLEAEAKADDNFSVCATCGKRIPESDTGTFTQWVFRSQLCDCERPVAVDAIHAPDRLSTSIPLDGGEKITPPPSGYLRLPRETFPIDRYSPIKQLGAGAGGAVYLCLDNHLSKYVSVKVLNHRSDTNLMAFQNEAKMTARFVHPNVVGIIDFGVTDGGAPFMVLEYINGITLDTIIKTEGAVPEKIAIELFIQIAEALEHGHESGIFHRDVKSSNIIVTRESTSDDSVRIIDFGVSALFEADQESTAYQGKTIVGTPKYMPPDQALGRAYDARSEIYSFGCVMYETLVGKLPFEADTAIDLLNLHTNSPVPEFEEINEDISVSPALEDIVMKCLQKNPDDRFASMKSLSNALNDLQREQSQTVSLPADTEEADMPPVNTKTWYAIAAVLSILSFALTFAVLKYLNLIEVQPSKKDVAKVMKKARKTEKKDRVELPDVETQLQTRAAKFDYIPTRAGMFQAKAKNLVVDEDLQILKGRTDINAVNVHRCEVEGPGLNYITELPLEALDINEIPIDDSALNYVQKMKKLRYLHMQGCEISDGSLEKIEKLPLVHLGLSKTLISNEGLKHVAQIKSLRILELHQTEKIDANAIATLKAMPNLGLLHVSIADKPEAFFKALGELKHTVILLHGPPKARCGITQKNLSMLTNEGIGFINVQVTKPIVATMRSLKGLKMLEFWGAGLTDDILADLATLPLEEVTIIAEPITDKGVELLARMKSLKVVRVEGCRIGSNTIAQLKKDLPRASVSTTAIGGFEDSITPSDLRLRDDRR